MPVEQAGSGRASARRPASSGEHRAQRAPEPGESLGEAGRAPRQGEPAGPCTCGPFLEAVSAAGCYDFFAKCPHRLACARCPFYLPKNTTKGQLLEVKSGIEQMLEQLDLTDDERQALEGDREAITALAAKLADVPTPAGPTPNQLGHAPIPGTLGTTRRPDPEGGAS